jgi:hypothetical protein
VAFASIAAPTAPAVKRAQTMSWSLLPLFSRSMESTPGKIPDDPAVGAATIRPMRAFSAATPRAAATAKRISPPQ